MEEFCAAHSGLEARISNLEHILDTLASDLKIVQKEQTLMQSRIEKKINQVFIVLMTVLLSIVAHLGYIIVQS